MNKTLLTILAIVAIASAIVIVGSQLFSNTVEVIVNPTQAIDLEADKAEVYHGEIVTLTATLSEGISDQPVTFLLGSTVLDTVESSGGIAIYAYTAVNSSVSPITIVFTATINVT